VGVGRQEEDCRALADRHDWTVGEVIVENDTSAYSTKATLDADGLPTRTTKRPEFRRALKALHNGTADGLIVYDIDRLARQPRDLEALIDLAEVRDVPVMAVTGSLDVSTSAGRAMSRVLVAMANKSSEDTGRRVARAARQRAELGIPKTDGFRPYGYDRDMVPIESEAAVIREVADRLLLGDSVRSIATDLNRRGIPAARGGEWRNGAVRSIVRKPTVAGLRAYAGDVVAEGGWPAILDRQTWELVTALLERRGGTATGRPGAARYLLSGLAVCALCGAKLYVGEGKKRPHVYRCTSCMKISRSMVAVDAEVTEVVRQLLRRDEIRRARARRGTRGSGATTTLLALRDRRRQILRDFAVNLAAADLAEMLAAVDARIAVVEAEASGRSAVPAVSPAEFDDLPLERKRAIIAALVVVTVPRAPEPPAITPAY